MFLKEFLKQRVARVVYMNFAWSLFNKEHWHYIAFRRLNPVSISFTREHETVLVHSQFFSIAWWRQTSLWCYSETADVTMAKTEVFILTSNLWRNLQYQNGKEVHLLSSYWYINSLNYVCTQTSLNKLLWICPPLSLFMREKYLEKVNTMYSLEFYRKSLLVT